jgi:ADP-heptose:LPS heptosyltransferase
MSFFYQEKHWEVGNFVMATPMLQLQAKKLGRPVPVFFDNRQVASLYKDASFIEILEKKPTGKAVFGSSRHPVRRRPDETDSEAYCRLQLNHTGPIPGTYVDRPGVSEFELERRNDRPHIAVFHGCHGRNNIKKKDIGAAVRQQILDGISARGMVPVLLGSKGDIDSYWRNNGLKHCYYLAGKLSLRESVAALSQCDAFISNDTGLYHVAGALQLPGMVLWKETDPVKNKSTFDGIHHIIDRRASSAYYKKHLDGYLEKLNGTLL